MGLITEKYIEEDYEFTSKNRDEFYSFLAESDVHTKNCKVRSDMVTVYAIRHDGISHDDDVPVWQIMPEKETAVAQTVEVNGKKKLIALNERFCPMSVSKSALMGKGNFNEFVRNVVASKDVMFGIYDMVCFMSKKALPTLCQRIKYDGGRRSGYLEQANEIAERMYRSKKCMQAVIKTFKGIGKVYAFMSEKYVPRALSEIEELEETIQKNSQLGKLEFISGTYNHDMCRVLYKFPHIRGLGTPCIEVINSDTGHCSYTISPCWQYETANGMTVYLKRLPISHCKNEISDDEIAKFVLSILKAHIEYLERSKKEMVTVGEELFDKLVESICGDVLTKRHLRQIKNCLKHELKGNVSRYELLKGLSVIPQTYAKALNPETKFKLKKKLENCTEIMEEMTCSV